MGILFGVLFIFAPHLIGAWIKQDGILTPLPLFNLAVWKEVLPLFLLSITAGIVDDFVKLVSRQYTRTVMAVTVVADTVSFALAFLIFKKYPVWNADFIPELERITGSIISSRGDILTYFNTDAFTNGLLLVLLFVFLLDMGTTVYYTVRYGEKE